MNLHRLTTFQGGGAEELPQSLIDEVLDMEDVYIKTEDGLRVHATNTTKLVSGQFFYIVASNLNGERITFKSSETCADYFGVTSATVNSRIAKRLSIASQNNINYTLSRMAL
jgi:hypothetical protein